MEEPVTEEKPWTGAVHKVWIMIERAGQFAHHIGDLIFTTSGPRLVLEWAALPDGDAPAVSVALDPRELTATPTGAAAWLYGLPVADPRPLH
jgi:hypothetical protein